MALGITNNTQIATGQVAGYSSPGIWAAAAPVPAPVKVDLPPIPKVEIRVDLERESQDLRAAISKLNDMMNANARSVSFVMDEKLGRPIVYIKNATTGEIVRQIPNEVVVQLAHSIEDFKGLLHNEKI